jgi:integrase
MDELQVILTRGNHSFKKSNSCHLTTSNILITINSNLDCVSLQYQVFGKTNYHSFRHSKATQLYHLQTKDILYVMKYLGHREVKNTLIYIDLETISFPHGGDDFHAKIARTEQEAIKLIEADF